MQHRLLTKWFLSDVTSPHRPPAKRLAMTRNAHSRSEGWLRDLTALLEENPRALVGEIGEILCTEGGGWGGGSTGRSDMDSMGLWLGRLPLLLSLLLLLLPLLPLPLLPP